MEELLLPEVKQETWLCDGCLSTDRRLITPKANTDLFMFLLGRYASSVSPDSVWLCWECSAVLQRVSRFQRQVQAAQASRMLTLNPEDENIPCISTLVKTDIDVWECLPNNVYLHTAHITLSPNCTLEIKKDKIDGTRMINKENSSITSEDVNIICKQEYQDDCVNEVDSFENDTDTADVSKSIDCPRKSKQLKTKRSKLKYSEYLDVRRNPAIDLSACAQWFAVSARDRAEGYRCKLCGWVASGADAEAEAGALRRHLKRHSRLYACTACRPHAPPPQPPLPAPSFLSYRDFYYHCRSLHTKYICDHCGTVRRTKATLSTHMRKFHDPEVLRRKQAPELRYCVECDKEFRSVKAYRSHVGASKLHNPHYAAHRKSDPSARVCGNKNIRDRANIIALHERGYKISEIARELKMTRGTVRHWVRRHSTGGGLADLPRDRPAWRRVSPDQVQQMLRDLEKYPETSTKVFAQRYSCSTRTIRTLLHKAGCGHYLKTPAHKRKKST